MDLNGDHAVTVARSIELVAQRVSSRPEPAREAVQLSALWTELVNGSCKVVGTGFTEQNCELTVARAARAIDDEIDPLPKRHAQILERSLIEGARKSVAFDLGLCPSTVAEILKQGFTFMGLSSWPSRVPLVFVLAAHAHRAKELARPASLLASRDRVLSRQTISVTRPDAELCAQLTPAEHEVTRLLVEGKSYAEMAVLRKTSVRTVANQLAAAFDRLGVSGRPELLCLLAARKGLSWRLSTPTSRSSKAKTDSKTGFLRVTSWNRR
ncbi:MAG TPA: helix-turn-helix transcriptional regulator [Polyangiaceae bacterium]|jgi:DNA-binding CsgD family transcriptional regulator|nr:helix-turn-helix transcriptional regulator [Polyangiaceae bacterium]